MSKHTKIVATISDRRCEVDFIQEIFDAGMNVVRMNSAHLAEEGFNKIITNVRAVSSEIAILMDTKGPEIRTTEIKDDETIHIKTGDRIRIIGDPKGITTPECIYCSYENVVKDLSIGTDLLIDDGEIDLRVIEKTDEYEVLKKGQGFLTRLLGLPTSSIVAFEEMIAEQEHNFEVDKALSSSGPV